MQGADGKRALAAGNPEWGYRNRATRQIGYFDWPCPSIIQTQGKHDLQTMALNQ
jgi:hypothetical protein